MEEKIKTFLEIESTEICPLPTLSKSGDGSGQSDGDGSGSGDGFGNGGRDAHGYGCEDGYGSGDGDCSGNGYKILGFENVKNKIEWKKI